MGTISGRVFTDPSRRGVPGLLLTAVAHDHTGDRRLGSVVTKGDGSFALTHRQNQSNGSDRTDRWDLTVTLAAPVNLDGTGPLRAGTVALLTETREDASPFETFRFVIPAARLTAAGIVVPEPLGADELIAREQSARDFKKRRDEERADRLIKTIRREQERRRSVAPGFHAFLGRFSSVPPQNRVTGLHGYLAPGADIAAENLRVIRRTLSTELPAVRATTFASISATTLTDLESRFGTLERIPAREVERTLWPWRDTHRSRIVVNGSRRRPCGGPPPDDCVALLEGAPPQEETPPESDPPPATAALTGPPLPDVAFLAHSQVDTATSPETPVSASLLRAGLGDVQSGVDSFVLRSGPADTPALFDFHNLQIAFEPVWQELFDPKVTGTAHKLYADLVEAGLDPNEYLGDPAALTPMGPLALHNPIASDVVKAFEITDAEWAALGYLQTELTYLARSANGQLTQAQSDQQQAYDFIQAELPKMAMAGVPPEKLGKLAKDLGAAPDFSAGQREARRQGERMIEYARSRLDQPEALDHYHELLTQLNASMKEPYRFDIYAANQVDRSLNFGIVVTYRQRWEPVAYQVGELVKTIPLAPKETRRFTKKTVTRRSRAEKEVTSSLRSRRTEASDTWRATSEIMAKAMAKTNFQLNAEGGVNIGIAHASGKTSLGHDAQTDSQEVKKEFREAVFKATEEYKEERSLQVETSDSAETTAEETGEISNPNDEIPVTYLFYQLQRRYRVSEEIYSVTPVLLVAQECPREIDDEWIVAHDWIIRRVLLDDSFQPALNYLASKVVGDEVALGELAKNVAQHRKLVRDLKDELVTIGKQLGARYSALETALGKHADAVQADEEGGGFTLMPVGFLLDDSNVSLEATRLREEAARDAHERAAKEQKELQARLDREVTALAAATQEFTKYKSEHLNRRAQIARLRVHIKANLFYYMQAIWSHEPPDQRFFRLHNIQVPRLVGTKTYKIEADPTAIPGLPHWEKPQKVTVHAEIDPEKLQSDNLADVADLDSPLGFKGNFMIIPMRKGNDLTDFLMTPYYDQVALVGDPDPLGNWTLHDLAEYVCCLRKQSTKADFERKLPGLVEAYRRMKELGANDGEIIVPTDSLYIEALPGVRPVLEDFKLLHRAVDVKKVQAEVRGIELENIRLAARLLAGEREDPTIDKKVVVEGGSPVVIPAADV